MTHTGSCLCKAVSFRVSGDLPKPDACHCVQCRKHSGHFFVSTNVPNSAVTIEGENKIKWFQSSEHARRGYCAECGSSLFFDPIQHDWIAIAMGAFDGPTGTDLEMHIFTAEKGDYYAISDGVPQHERGPDPTT